MARISYSKPDDSGERTWTPLPEGKYTFQIEEVDGARVSKGGHPQVMVKCVVVGGPNDGKKATIFYTNSPAATWRFDSLVAACGIAVSEGPDGIELDDQDLVGCYFQCLVKQRTWEGKTTNDYSKEEPSPLSNGAQTASAAQAQAPAVQQAAKPAAAAPAPQAQAQGQVPVTRRSRTATA